jgi:hypothetical protein
MAERQIGIRIELNGFRGVINNIKQLEEEIKKAQEDLDTLAINSDTYNELNNQLSVASKKLGDLRKASEGISVEKKLEGYGKLAAGITSSFAAAQSAVQLFGGESTAVGEAAIQVQNLLTVALAARGVEEVIVGANIVARTIAEKAATAATVTSNGALKALYTTIAANPLGALLTAITLVVGAMVLWNQESEDSVDIQKELNVVVSAEASKLNTYNDLLKDVNTSNNARYAIIEDLKKTYPGFNVFLDKENKLTKDGVIFINNKVRALTLQAKAQELVKRITEEEGKVLKVQNQSIEESLTLWDKTKATLATLFSSYGELGGQYVKVTAAEENKNEATKGSNKIIKTSKDLLKDLEDQLGEIEKENLKYEKAMKAQADADAAAAKGKDKLGEATKAQIALEKQLNNDLKDLENTYTQLLKFFEEVGKTTLVKTPKPEILNTLEGLVKVREELQKDPLEKVFETLGFQVDIAGGKLGEIKSKFDGAKDSFGEFYESLRKDLTENVISITPEEYGKKLGAYLDQANKLLLLPEGDPNKITKEAFTSLQAIITQYQKLNTLIKTPPGISDIFDNESLTKFYDTQKQIGIAQEQIKYELDKTDGSIKDVDKSQALLYTQTEKQKEQLMEWSKELTAFYTAGFLDKDETKRLNLVNRLNLTPEQKEKIKESWTDTSKDITKIIQQIVEAQLKGVVEISNTLVQEESDIRNFYVDLQKAITQGQKLDASTRKEIFLKNKEALYNVTQESNKIVIDAEMAKKDQIASVADFVIQLGKKGVDITKLTEKEKYEIYKFYLDKQLAETEKAEKEKEDSFKKRIEQINFYLQEFSKAITSAASIAAQVFQLQLSALENKYNDTMGKIVGDTKEADQKRIESEKSYQAQKAAIERKAQIAALKFSLASTIATGAQAVVSALVLPPPANIIVGALNAAITAAQVAVIAAQISQIQSTPLRRGGLLSGGGFISGPSHEQGGVYAGGGYVLEGNESVINRQSTLQYSGLLSQINQSGGGRPIVVQSPMDSRLVEAIAKQKTEPIRAYVVEQDITRAQTINRRLEQLASF